MIKSLKYLLLSFVVLCVIFGLGLAATIMFALTYAYPFYGIPVIILFWIGIAWALKKTDTWELAK